MNKTKMPSRKEWAEKRYRLFNEKVDSFRDHEKYSWLRKYADDAIVHNEGGGYTMIAAEDFIKRIEQMPIDYIGDWLDGKNNLEWNLVN